MSSDTLSLLFTPKTLTAGAIGAVISAFFLALFLRTRPSSLPSLGLPLLISGILLIHPPLYITLSVLGMAGTGLAISMFPQKSQSLTRDLLFLFLPVLIAINASFPGPSWAPAAWIITALLGGAGWLAFTRHSMRQLGPVLFTLAAGGVFFCVPDTEHAVLLFAMTVIPGMTGWPFPFARLSGESAGLAGLLTWIVLQDGAAREGAIVGGAACIGVAVSLLLALLVTGQTGQTRQTRQGKLSAPWYQREIQGRLAIPVMLICCLTVGIISRIAGLQEDPVLAGTIAFAALFAAVGAHGLILTRDHLVRDGS